MKIQGSSKIIAPDTKAEEIEAVAVDTVNAKQALESLITEAEVVDILHENVSKSKLKKILAQAQELIDKTKPFRDEHKEKIGKKLGEMVVKFRGLSPHADRLVTALDKSVKYIAAPNPLDDGSDVVQETRAPAVFGIWVMIITFGFFMMWAIIAPLNSASHAIGKIVLDSKKRIIQNFEGGVIKEILVRDGQEVIKGQTLILLDDAQFKARHQQIEYKYFAALAEVAKLTAEKDDLTEIKFPEELLAKAGDPEAQKIIQNQEKSFAARKEAYDAKVEHQKESITQFIEKKNAILPQIEANKHLVKIYKEQAESYRKLYQNKNIRITELRDAEIRYSDALGKEGAFRSELAAAEQEIIKAKITAASFKNDDYEKVTAELKDQQANLSIVAEQLKEVNESLKRTVIAAPETGVVSALSEGLTPRGVLQAGAPLMEIIPQDDELIIEAKILATDIAAVKVGQTSYVRLTAYRARIVPVLEGKLVSLSADIAYPDQRDMQGGMQQPYYKARIVINKEHFKEIADMKDVILYPGMGVDVMITIGTRTMMKYLMDPITLTLDHAFRER